MRISSFSQKLLILLLMTTFAVIFLSGCAEQQSAKKHYTVATISNNPNGLVNVKGFVDGLKELGYVEGQNLTILTAGKAVPRKELDATIAEYVKANVDLIFTAGTPTGVAAHRVTKDTGTAVVFGVIADPVAAGVLTDLNTPGGNMTGVKLSQDQGRRLEMFLQMVPTMKNLLIMYNPNDMAPVSAVNQIKQLIGKLDVNLTLVETPDNEAVTDTLTNLPPQVDGIYLVPDSLVNKRIKDIAPLCLAKKIPLCGPSSAQVKQGALAAIGINHSEVGKQAARIASAILKGTEPGNLPVETAESYLFINQVTARSIGVEIPAQMLRNAVDVIRD